MLKRLFARSFSSMPGNPGLSASEISAHIRKEEQIHKLKVEARHIEIHHSTFAANVINEDAKFLGMHNNKLMFGVLDGHWSNRTSTHLEKRIPDVLAANLGTEKEAGVALLDTFLQIDSSLQKLPLLTISGMSPEEITEIPIETRELIVGDSLHSFDGACALVGVVDLNSVSIAHAGDCRAILGRKIEDSWQVDVLTHDHQPSNPSEMARLVKEHPGEPKVAYKPSHDGPIRVLGGMMPSRVLGDCRYKWSLEDQARINALLVGLEVPTYSTNIPQDLKTPPYLTATPQINQRNLSPSDKFIVAGTDGLFDVLSNRRIVDLVRQWIEDPRIDENAATWLIRNALQGNSQSQAHLSRMITIPKNSSRMYRDDITVMVIFLE